MLKSLNHLFAAFLFSLFYFESFCDNYVPNFETNYENNHREHCNSEIYCYGELLHDVQTKQVFQDGTIFVNKALKYPEKYILRKYAVLKNKTGGIPSTEELRTFIDEYFIDDVLLPFKFHDFTQNPSILNKTNVVRYKWWLAELNILWNKLGGIIPADVKIHPHRHSYLYVPNGFMKAGGRFTEAYYWDSYWIITGLLLCDMTESARGIIENIISLTRTFGHMPNGNRIYYIKRSQPPMLVNMAHLFLEQTNNFTFIKNNIDVFDREFRWWSDNRQVQVKKDNEIYQMFTYNSTGYSPRPESYKEDYNLVVNLTNKHDVMKILSGIKSAAESGWDFSSRHIRGQNSSNIGTLSQMEPQRMVYVDLNSIMHFNARALKTWHKQLGDKSKANQYEKIENNLLKAIENVLWNEEVGIWQDYDLFLEKHRNYFYISNFTPLWCKTFEMSKYLDRVIQYLISEKIINTNYEPVFHCVPTSLYETAQQWDFPNCWAPMQSFLIHGLHDSRDINAKAEIIAFNLAQKWIETVYAGFYSNASMYEKYDATKLGCSGGGGEYKPQKGFGWTNGFTMDLFNIWGNKIKLIDPTPTINC